MSSSIFGTDGIRGRAGEGWLTPAGARAVGRAAGEVLGANGAEALLAHDGRASADELVGALAAGLREAGLAPRSAGLLPTPGLAWLTRSGDAALGLMVSASHNPAHDNGIKVFGRDGDKPDDALQGRIEELLRGACAPDEANHSSSPAVESDEALRAAYLGHLRSFGADLGEGLAGRRVVLDCANGAGSSVAPELAEALGLDARCLFASPDGANINAGCGSTHPEALQRAVADEGALLGVALDGDGDRCILVDESGALVDGDGILTILGRAMAEGGELPGNAIAATVMSNRALHIALEERGVRVVETAVGDRAVVDALKEHGLHLGGEQSGHVVLGERNGFIGDGLVTALAVLRVMASSGQPLSALAAPYQRLPQVLLNVPVRSKPPFEELPLVQEEVRAAEEALGSRGRVLLRYSGTEPLARVMVEGPDLDQIGALAERVAQRLRERIGAEA